MLSQWRAGHECEEGVGSADEEEDEEEEGGGGGGGTWHVCLSCEQEGELWSGEVGKARDEEKESTSLCVVWM